MLHLKLKPLLLTAIFFCILLSGGKVYSDENLVSKNEFNFEEGLLPEDVSTYSELRIWALYQFFELIEDSRAYGLQDNVCRMIPETGLSFLLGKDTERKGRMYLYLDLTQYIPQKKARFAPRKLSIFVNGQLKREIYTMKEKQFSNPVEIWIEPSEFESGKIKVELIPSKNMIGRFWGIWDAFLVENQLKAEEKN